MINNPFDITKAVDYTDEEICRYWVDINESGFYRLINPENLMPMIIVGSKGSGKTHIMKYFSYELQKITKPIDEGIKLDKFIGVYIRCSGFNADKFSGKGVSDDIWASLYAYYWELWIGERITAILIDLQKNNIMDKLDESSIVNDVLNLFTKKRETPSTLTELRDYFLDLQKNLEYEVQNFLFQGKDKPNVELLIPVACLSYGYPRILKEKIEFFRDKYILYLIDELENFSEKQQELIQSLLREKPVACTFRVGTRPYGIRTYKTLGGNEENHDGSEFHKVVLDDFLRTIKEDDYERYIAKICESRLRNSGLHLCEDFRIENYIEEQSNEDTIEKVFKKKESQSRAYMRTLKKDLKLLKNVGLNDEDIDKIYNNLEFSEAPIIERTNVLLIYRQIKDKCADLLKYSMVVRESARSYYLNKDVNTLHYKCLDKYKQDIVDAIARDGRVNISYYGFKKLVKLSCGTPRTMLRLLKAAYSAQFFETAEEPFINGAMLSIKAQRSAITSTYQWFFEENRIPSSCSRAVDAVVQLGRYLQELRFSDIPPQCSINLFTVSKESMSNRARETFRLLESYSYFVKSGDRILKNTVAKNAVYTLNSILLPKWELSLSKRGMIQLSPEDAESIFNLEKKNEFSKFLSTKLKQYTFPFGRLEDGQGTQEYLSL